MYGINNMLNFNNYSKINENVSISSDLTSVINYFENNKARNIYSFNNFHVLNINEQLQLLKLWLRTTVSSYVQQCNLNDLNDVLANLNQLQQTVCNLNAQVKERRKLKEQNEKISMTCSKCNESFVIVDNESFLEHINTHKHFEEQLASLVRTQSKTGDDLKSCVIQIEDDEPAIRNYAPDVNYNFRFNFNVVPYCTVPMFIPVAIPPTRFITRPIMPPQAINMIPSPIPSALRPMKPVLKVQPQQPNDYGFTVKHTLYPKSIMKQHDKYMLQLRNGKCFCLICLSDFDSIKNMIMEHLTGKRHTKLLENALTMDTLTQYHYFWMQQREQYQLQQVYFNPISKNFMQCVTCKRHIGFGDMETHLSSSEHIINCNKVQAASHEESLDTSDATSTNSEVSTSVNHNTNNKKNVKHDLKKSITKNITFFDQLELRFRAHLPFLNETADTISCKLCSTELPKLIETVKEHILSSIHKDLAKIPVVKRKFYCGICKKHQKDEKKWLEHLKDATHLDIFGILDESTKITTMEYQCSCGSILFGSKEVIQNHSKSSEQGTEIKLRKPILKLLKSNSSFSKEIEALVEESNELLKLKNDMTQCCKEIEKAVKDIYPNCKAYPFGSRVTGLGDKDSDLDVFLDIGDMYHGNQMQDGASQKKILNKVKGMFYKRANVFVDINPIPTARTPIIQVIHVPTDIDFDISFKNGLSIENTKFVKLCINLQEVTRPLILFLKKLMKVQRLNTNISTYAISMMVIFYLQNNNHLLPVHALKSLNNKPIIIQDWEAIDLQISVEEIKQLIKPCNKNLKNCLKSFFTFYANFNFKADVICPLLGRPIKKNDFIVPLDGSALPIEMQAYVKKLTNPAAEIFRATSELCVQDPFDLSHNLTKACPASQATRFKKLCDLMVKELLKI